MIFTSKNFYVSINYIYMCAESENIIIHIILFSFICIKTNSTERQNCEETKTSVGAKLDTIGTDETIVQTR